MPRILRSTGSLRLNRPIVGMATTWQGHGYWMVGNDGGMFNFGDAHFYGSAANSHATIVGMAPTVSSHGYYLAGTNGQVFPYGDAHYWGSVASASLTAPVVAISPRAASRASVGPTPTPTPTPTPGLAVTTTHLRDTIAGLPYLQTLSAAHGAAPYRWSARGLPGGIALAIDGTLQGTPTAATSVRRDGDGHGHA